MKVRIIQLATCVLFALSVGCQNRPLKSELVGFPRVLSNDDEVNFKIRLRNLSPIPQTIPTEPEVRYCIEFEFIPDADVTSLPAGFRLDPQHGIDLSPPSFEKIGPFAKRDYNFIWTPPKGYKGKGVLVVELLQRLPRIKPIDILIE